MKIKLSLFTLCILLSNLQAQELNDALRYSTDRTTGTARYNALSGAMGALGGDFSAIAINPAGSAVFLNSALNVSFAVNDTENKVSYFNTNTKSINTDLSLNQAGGVFVFTNANEESVWKKFMIALNFDTTNNFENELFIKGTSNSSIDQFFLQQAQGIPLNLLQLQGGESISDLYSFLGETEGVAAQNAFLGFQGFIFDPVDGTNSGNTAYVSNISPGNFNQEYAYLSDGYNGKYTINFGTQVTNNFFLGVNLNTHTIDYRQSTFLFETNNNSGSTVNQVGFENNLSVLGSGFSAQIGAIAKIQEKFRVGLSFTSPEYYIISEETTQSLQTRRTEADQIFNEFIDPQVLNVYADYDYKTPGIVGASAAYIFGGSGLISFDYSFKDYSNIEFGSNSDPSFNELNNQINNRFQAASTYKLGGEYRIKNLSLRGGVRYEESSYKDELTVGDLQGFSLGLGYNFGNYNLDLAYSRAEQDRNQQLYNVGLTTAGAVNTTYSNLLLSLGFKF